MFYTNTICTAFEGSKCIATGELRTVALVAKLAVDAVASQPNKLRLFWFLTMPAVKSLSWIGVAALPNFKSELMHSRRHQ